MLNLIEKIQYCFTIFILLVVVTLYVVLGGPTTESLSTMPPAVEEPDPAPRTPSPEADPGSSTRSQEALARLREDRAILGLLAKNQGVSASRLERRKVRIPEETFDFAAEPRNWLPELNKAASRLLRGRDGRPTMLEIFDIEEVSLFKTLGFQEGDRFLLIDDSIMEFDANQSQHYYQFARRSIEKLRSGDRISFTVLRKGRPVRMEFSVPR